MRGGPGGRRRLRPAQLTAFSEVFDGAVADGCSGVRVVADDTAVLAGDAAAERPGSPGCTRSRTGIESPDRPLDLLAGAAIVNALSKRVVRHYPGYDSELPNMGHHWRTGRLRVDPSDDTMRSDIRWRGWSVAGGHLYTGDVVRVLVADDDALARRVVVSALVKDGCEVVAQVAAERDLLAQVEQHRPDVVVVDIGRPAFGNDLIRSLGGVESGPRVLVLTVREEIPLARQSLISGASGYLLKEDGSESLGVAVRAVAAGHLTLPPRLVRALVEPGDTPVTVNESALGALTRSERLVLGMVAEGMTTTQVARRLSVTPATVKSHMSHLFRKLGVQDRAQAVAVAYRRGLVSAPATERSADTSSD
jgi:DNA-binding NarL/FixJ family response regulator